MKGEELKAFTYNDYIDYLPIRKQVQKYLRKNKIINMNSNTILNKIDKTIIYSIQDQKLIKEFLQNSINSRIINIKKETLEKYHIKDKNNLIQEEEMEIYKIKSKEIYFIIQYTTKKNQNISYNILATCIKTINQWKQTKNQTKKENKNTPTIFPIIIYTGDIIWDKNNKKDLNKHIKIKENGIYFSYNIIDINNYTIKQLQNKNSIIFNLITFKKLNSYQRKKYLESLIKNCSDNYKKNKLKDIYNYFYNKPNCKK